MIALTLNSGSTSVKLAAYATANGQPPRLLRNEHYSGHALEAHAMLEDFLSKLAQRPETVVHRVVHGGTRFTQPTRIDDTVVAAIDELSELAPLHNPKALEWIRAAREVCGPPVAHIAVFDTAFFAGLPRVASEYALPPDVGVEQGVRRYGFHGLAHEAMWRRWSQLHPQLPRGGRLVSFQLGGGCSVTATDAGRPVDTSMGFSPLEGLVMATRSGDVDPAIVPYLQQRLKISSDEVIERLNRRAGLAGLSGTDNNPEELLASCSPQARFAVELYCYRARKYLGAYLAVLGGCDGIVFGGGVGEHVPGVRERILSGMQWAGIELDRAANEAARGQESRIDSPSSRVRVQVVKVDEELVMVRAAEGMPPAA
jgi:acetate kinase